MGDNQCALNNFFSQAFDKEVKTLRTKNGKLALYEQSMWESVTRLGKKWESGEARGNQEAPRKKAKLSPSTPAAGAGVAGGSSGVTPCGGEASASTVGAGNVFIVSLLCDPRRGW